LSRGDRKTELLGVPIDDDGGEQVQPCDAEMLALSCTVADFALPTDPQCVLQSMMCFPFVEAKLRRRTERALLVQKRSQARKRLSGSNRPPECIRFNRIPPADLRSRLKAAEWLYDPVAVIWYLPEDPSHYEASEVLLRELEAYDIEKLDMPDPKS